MLYGKWRPQGFAEVVGQDHIVTTLKNSLATGQVAHAYLFSGPRGTGKTTTARILARALNCQSPKSGEPCNQCDPCRAIARGAALDLIEMDAASNRGIEDVRELREKIAFAPSDLKMKVYLLDEVHMLTQGAWNALLKTLEEPPPHAVFILATTEAHQVPATILSRCQRYDFHRVPNQAIVQRLKVICDSEGFAIPHEGLTAIAVHSRGGMRDAITLVEQVVARYGTSPSTEEVLSALGLVQDERCRDLARALAGDELAAALVIARDAADDGVDLARFTRATIDVLRDALLQSLRGVDSSSVNAGVAHLAVSAGTRKLTTIIAELAKADFRLDPGNPVPLEVACAAALFEAAPAGDAAAAAVAAQPARAVVGGTAGRNIARDPAPSSEEDRFLRNLSERCRLVSVQAGALLNGQCEVVRLTPEEVVIGFYLPVLKAKVENFLPLVTAKAEEILGHPVAVSLAMIEKAAPRRSPRGGHLAEAARAIGATPVRGAVTNGQE